MIDWLTIRGILCTFSPQVLMWGGRVDYDEYGKIIFEWKKPRPIKGSHDTQVSVRADPKKLCVHLADGMVMGCLEISGNPSKLFQGHNLFGTNDLQALARAMIYFVIRELGITLDQQERNQIESGKFAISRVDITESWVMDSRAQVLTAIQTLERSGYLRHRGRGVTKGSTVYWGKNSRRWALKAYCKAEELEAKGHGIHEEHPQHDLLVKHAENLLRVELCLRGKELEDRFTGLNFACSWDEKTAQEQYQRYFQKLEIADDVVIAANTVEGMPNRLQVAYQLWIDGHDLRGMYKPATFYRYRRQLAEYGIDIANKRVSSGGSEKNLISLKKLFQKPSVPIPDWAYGTKSCFDPLAKQSAGSEG